MIRRPPRSTLDRSSAASDVYKRQALNEAVPAGAARLRIRTFAGEIDPWEFSLLDSGHLVLFRKVWREDERFIQGLLLDPARFLAGAIEAQFRPTLLAGMSDLCLLYTSPSPRDRTRYRMPSSACQQNNLAEANYTSLVKRHLHTLTSNSEHTRHT